MEDRVLVQEPCELYPHGLTLEEYNTVHDMALIVKIPRKRFRRGAVLIAKAVPSETRPIESYEGTGHD